MTDAKTIEEMRTIIERVESRSRKDGIGLYEACKREGVPKTTFYTYKERLGREPMMQAPAPQIEQPVQPQKTPEEVVIPEKQKHKKHPYRVNVDLTKEAYEMLLKESKETTFSRKAICQNIIIKHYKEKQPEQNTH